ncbi:MAG: UbiX family flavin prenyltransferase [Phycisphaerales bacterium]|nr:UbiX family flavin prenyltransferase [Phycisphaerales bacterium]
MKQIVLGITGASGAIYAQRLAQAIVRAGAHLHVVASPLGQRLFADELGLRRISAETLLGAPQPQVTLYPHRDTGARLASGSFHTDGMVICPCSGHTLAAVAAGISDNLVTRAAAVTLKEARRLVLVPREMPLSQIELANMLRISQAGGIICPACPGFYMLPKTIDDLIDFVVGRILDLVGLPHTLNIRWDPAQHQRPASSAENGDEE